MRIPVTFILAHLIFASAAATAGTITFSQSGIPSGSTHPVNVSATFKNVGGDLEIELFNNAAGTDPLQILSGLFWDVSGSAPTGTSLASAVTASGSLLYTSGTSGVASAELRNSELGGQLGWEYRTPPGLLDGVSYQFGLGSSGLSGSFGGLANASYGIIGPGSSIGQVPLKNQLPLVMSTSSSPSSAVFLISGFGTDVSQITNVTFAFGSAGENNMIFVPEPTSLALAGFALVCLVAFSRSAARGTSFARRERAST